MFKKVNCLTASVILLLTLLPLTASADQGPIVQTDLLAGQTIDVGDVVAWSEDGTLYVQYLVDGDWYMTESHLHVADSPEDIPQNNGNPAPGQFDHKTEHDPTVTEFTYAVPLDDELNAGEVYIAAHAVVCTDGEGEGGECIPAQTVLDVVTLWAGQHIDAGTVTVATDGENLIVTYEVTPPWGLKETHLYVGTEPPSKMAPGRFPYKHEGLDEATVDEYVIPLAELGVGCDDTLYLATHAALESDEPGYGGETGWGEGVPSGKGWSMYFSVTVTCECEEPGPSCETAWADGEDFPGSNWATYFTYQRIFE
jgi:hypothetical protein